MFGSSRPNTDADQYSGNHHSMKIGVLAIQGDFAEHIVMLKRLKVETAEVRLPEHLKNLDGLIIPGGESTTIGKLATDYGLIEPLQAVWPASRHLGYVCGRDLSLEGCQAQPTPAGPDGYHRGAQCLWPASRFVRGRPGYPCNETGNRDERTCTTRSSSALPLSSRCRRMQRSWPASRTGELWPRNRATCWPHPFTPS